MAKTFDMRVLILIFISFIISFYTAVAQEYSAVDYLEIYAEITDENSDLYYPNLLERYRNNDPSLTNREYRALYYGFTFQENYRPYDRDPRDLELSELISAGLDEDNLPNLIELAKTYLEDKPFSLKVIHYLQNFLAATGEQEEVDLLQIKYDGILNAILSSGDGLSLETGYAVNDPSDEYMILRALNYTPIDHQFETTMDYFLVAENEDNVEGLYFDVYQMAKIGTAQMGIETIEVENEEIPENGILVGSRDEILAFIPTGFQVLDELQVDYDGDQDLDWVLVLKKEGEEMLSNASADDPEPRVLKLLERKEDKSLVETLSSETVIPCIDCGEGNEQDPYQSIDFKEGILSFYTSGGNLFVWERKTSFIYDNGFKLFEESLTSYRKGKKKQAQEFKETAEDFGEISLSEFNFNTLFSE